MARRPPFLFLYPLRSFPWRRLSLLSLLSLILPGAESYKPISDDTLRSLARPNDDFDIHTGPILAPILQPRVPGTEGSTAVLNHFVNFFSNELPEWNIEFQNSTSITPIHNEQVPFVNMIASRDPPWASEGDVGRLTLVAHYDSKFTPLGFIGAIDSAAPCAMIMHAVRSINSALTKKWDDMQESGEALDQFLEGDTGIQVLFLDGEEAFLSWTATDSLYGARSLAETWDNTPHAAMSTYKTLLSSITLFILLDLLGSENPMIRSYFPTTHWAYRSMAKLEQRFRELQEFKSSPNYPSKSKRDRINPTERAEEPTWFIDGSNVDMHAKRWSGIQDDHIPFLQRGVEILHLIDTPASSGFPKVWHTLDDDGEHLNLDTVEDWSMLLTAFVAEWMELDGFIRPASDTDNMKNRRLRSDVASETASSTGSGSASPVGTAVQSKESRSGGTVQLQLPKLVGSGSNGKTEL